ncbi:MAG: Dam family site-specific DNA-(adenine-N6)-methyltransferase, partial [Candidatus Odinarchaeota archaeon]
MSAKPFLKWAGGKGQLLEELFKRVPDIIKKTGVVTKYIEPFVGGGAFFFFLKSKFNVENAYLFDINPELIIAFKVVQREPENLIKKLKKLESKYLSSNKEERRKLYYEIRSLYNQQIYGFNYENYNEEWIERSAFLIFLNKTCYNGLYRQNRKGEFNVPFGDYKKPRICDSENILKVSRALKNIEIFTEDFSKSEKYVEAGTFLYLDPPYRPINQTS